MLTQEQADLWRRAGRALGCTLVPQEDALLPEFVITQAGYRRDEVSQLQSVMAMLDYVQGEPSARTLW